jgi:hypothetical protein
VLSSRALRQRRGLPQTREIGAGSDPAVSPAAGTNGRGLFFARQRTERGIMASDISLAVGDGARRMTYAELAQAQGESLASARRLARRHHWHRQVGNDGIVRVTVPLGQLRAVPRPTSERAAETSFAVPGPAQAMSHGTDSRSVADGPGTDPTPSDSVSHWTDPLTVIAIETLSQAVEMLREYVERERARTGAVLVGTAGLVCNGNRCWAYRTAAAIRIASKSTKTAGRRQPPRAEKSRWLFGSAIYVCDSTLT